MYKGSFDVELSIRQYFFFRILGESFNKSFLYSVGSGKPLKHPLPKEWRNVLIEKGIKVDNFSCAVLWRAYSFIIWGSGVLQGLRALTPGTCRLAKNLTESRVPRKLEGSKSLE